MSPSQGCDREEGRVDSAATSARHLSQRRNSQPGLVVNLPSLSPLRAARAPCPTHALRVQGRRPHGGQNPQALRAPPEYSRFAPVGSPPVHDGLRRRGPPPPDSSRASRLAQRETQERAREEIRLMQMRCSAGGDIANEEWRALATLCIARVMQHWRDRHAANRPGAT